MRKIYIIILLIVTSYAAQAQIFVAADATGNTDGSSWANAYTNLQDGIDAAMALGGEVIWVKAGTYRRAESGSRNQKFLINTSGDISIYGGFNGTETALSQRDFRQNVTTISGEYGTNQSTFNQFLEVTTGDNRLDGFHISGFNNNSAPSGVITVSNGGSLTVANCVINNNFSSSGNLGSIALTNDGVINFHGCNFYDNQVSLSIIIVRYYLSPSLVSEVINCTMTNNNVGLFIISELGPMKVVNNTIYGNTNSGAAFNLSLTDGSEIYNNIIWNNSSSQIGTGANMIVNSNIIEGTSLNGNFSIDPQLKDPSSGDYRLKSCSPARNQGNNAFLPAAFTADINGEQRIFDTTIDLGAYEQQGFPIQINTFETFDVVCFGSSTGEVAIGAVGGTGPLEYSIDGINFTDQPLIQNLSSGNYTITVRDEDGCTETGLVDVNEITTAAVGATVNSVDNTCFNESLGSLALVPSGGVSPYTFSIDGTTFQSSPTFTGLAAGNYQLTVLDALGCDFTIAGNVGQPNEISSTVMVTEPSCNGDSDGSITITTSGGTAPYQYSIDNVNFQSSEMFSGLEAGSLTVFVLDDNGCTGFQDIVITEPNTLTASLITSPACFDETNGSIEVIVTGGSSPFEYSIDGTNFQSSDVFENLAPSSYTISILDAKGCTTSSQNSIDENAEINISNSASMPGCNGDSNGEITLTASGGSGTFEFSLDGVNYQSNNEFNGLSAGDYTVIVRDASNCSASSNISISAPDILSLSASFNGSQVNLAASGGTAPYEYSEDGTTFQSSPVFILANGQYTFTVRDANGCTANSAGDLVITSFEPNPEIMFSVFPNPSNTNIIIESIETIKMVRIINFNGKVLKSARLNEQKIALDISTLEDGIYLIEVMDTKGQVNYQKFLKE